jgi:hypothetical protein
MREKNVNGASRRSNFWNFFDAIQMCSCLARLVNMDETWLYHYGPETKQYSMDWRHSFSPRHQKFRLQIPLEKFSPRFFGDQDGILIIDCLPTGQTVNAEYYSYMLVQFKSTLKEKRRGNFTKEVLFLHNDAPAHRALANQKKLD